jgi:hypothetical protein
MNDAWEHTASPVPLRPNTWFNSYMNNVIRDMDVLFYSYSHEAYVLRRFLHQLVEQENTIAFGLIVDNIIKYLLLAYLDMAKHNLPVRLVLVGKSPATPHSNAMLFLARNALWKLIFDAPFRKDYPFTVSDVRFFNYWQSLLAAGWVGDVTGRREETEWALAETYPLILHSIYPPVVYVYPNTDTPLEICRADGREEDVISAFANYRGTQLIEVLLRLAKESPAKARAVAANGIIFFDNGDSFWYCPYLNDIALAPEDGIINGGWRIVPLHRMSGLQYFADMVRITHTARMDTRWKLWMVFTRRDIATFPCKSLPNPRDALMDDNLFCFIAPFLDMQMDREVEPRVDDLIAQVHAGGCRNFDFLSLYLLGACEKRDLCRGMWKRINSRGIADVCIHVTPEVLETLWYYTPLANKDAKPWSNTLWLSLIYACGWTHTCDLLIKDPARNLIEDIFEDGFTTRTYIFTRHPRLNAYFVTMARNTTLACTVTEVYSWCNPSAHPYCVLTYFLRMLDGNMQRNAIRDEIFGGYSIPDRPAHPEKTAWCGISLPFSFPALSDGPGIAVSLYFINFDLLSIHIPGYLRAIRHLEQQPHETFSNVLRLISTGSVRDEEHHRVYEQSKWYIASTKTVDPAESIARERILSTGNSRLKRFMKKMVAFGEWDIAFRIVEI